MRSPAKHHPAPRMNLFTPDVCRVWCVLSRGELEPKPARVPAGAIYHDVYGGFDGMPPYGVRIHLRSVHGDLYLAAGEDDAGDTEKALARLAAKVAGVMPGVTPDFIRSLGYKKPTPVVAPVPSRG